MLYFVQELYCGRIVEHNSFVRVCLAVHTNHSELLFFKICSLSVRTGAPVTSLLNLSLPLSNLVTEEIKC